MENWVYCSECEECYNCYDATNRDGCEFGIKSVTEEEKGEEEE